VQALLQEAASIGTAHAQVMLKKLNRAFVIGSYRNLFKQAKNIVSGIIDHVNESIQKALGKEQDEDEALSQSDVVDETISDLIDELPELIAEDEVTTVVEGSVLDELTQAGIAEVQSVSEGDGKVCEMCLGNEDAGPIPIGSAFPSGHTCSPFHNRCRCNIVPV
jgi:hypothetical protein